MKRVITAILISLMVVGIVPAYAKDNSKANAKSMYQIMISKKISKNYAIASVAAAKTMSNVSPTVKSRGYEGIYLWGNARLQNLKKYAKSHRMNYRTIKCQTPFALYEMKTLWRRKLPLYPKDTMTYAQAKKCGNIKTIYNALGKHYLMLSGASYSSYQRKGAASIAWVKKAIK